MPLSPACIKALDKLRRSATFAMSLGAKELFHTNFLAFVLESDEPQLEELQKSLRNVLGLPWQEGELTRCLVWREFKNLDLVLVALEPTAGATLPTIRQRAVCVEVKLKSVPTPEQLNDYSQKLASGLKLVLPEEFNAPRAQIFGLHSESINKVLLSPRNATPPAPGWHWTNWQAVAALFTAVAQDPKEKDGLRAVLVDYGQALKDLHVVIDWVDAAFCEFQNNDLPFSALVEAMNDQGLRDRRLHDLAGKYFFSLLETAIRTAVVKQCTPLPDEWSLSSYTSFSRSIPMLGLEVTATETRTSTKKKKIVEEKYRSVNIGVQIQGNSYRHYLAVTKPINVLEELAVESFLGWFTNSPFEASMAGTMVDTNDIVRAINGPRNVRHSNLKVFGKDKFLYSDVNCASATFETLVAAVVKSITKAKELCTADSMKCVRAAFIATNLPG